MVIINGKDYGYPIMVDGDGYPSLKDCHKLMLSINDG